MNDRGTSNSHRKNTSAILCLKGLQRGNRWQATLDQFDHRGVASLQSLRFIPMFLTLIRPRDGLSGTNQKADKKECFQAHHSQNGSPTQNIQQ
tara:strand:- start:853 stop:1131 length:279 start_codon:yes stop_codon:yes gene_type:complete